MTTDTTNKYYEDDFGLKLSDLFIEDLRRSTAPGDGRSRRLIR
jgi:hypothetical protein